MINIYEMRENAKLKVNVYPLYKNMTLARQYIDNASEVLLKLLKSKKFRHYNIIFRGSSGTITATLLYLKLIEVIDNDNITLVLSRKKNETSHDYTHKGSITSSLDYCNIVIDDFISNGDTLDELLEDVHNLKRIDYLIMLHITTNPLLIVKHHGTTIENIITRRGQTEYFNLEEEEIPNYYSITRFENI